MRQAPAWVKLILLAYIVCAALLIAAWIWLPFVILTVIWCGLRIGQAYPRYYGETAEQARNRNTGRRKTPFTVHLISGIFLAVACWYIFIGSTAHPLH